MINYLKKRIFRFIAVALISILALMVTGFKLGIIEIIIPPAFASSDIDLLLKSESDNKHTKLGIIFDEIRKDVSININTIENLSRSINSSITDNQYIVLKNSVLKLLESEKKKFIAMNKAIKKNKNNQFPTSLNTNQMVININGAKKLIKNSLPSLLSGEYLQKFKDKHHFNLICQRCILSSSETTYLKVALMAIAYYINPDFKEKLINDSHMYPIQVFKLPSTFFAQRRLSIDSSSLFFRHTSPTTMNVIIVHNGYVFGGSRIISETDPEHFTELGYVYDCSSWIEKLGQANHYFSTLDMLYLHRYKFLNGIVDPSWLGTNGHISISKTLEPILVNSIFDIKPGMVFAKRTFKFIDSIFKNKNVKKGKSGHTGIVLHINHNEKYFLVASYSRKPPFIDGLVISKYQFKEKFKDKNFFFNLDKW